MNNNEAPQRRRYRLNGKKFASALLTLVLIAGFIAVAAFSLEKAGLITAAAADNPSLPKAAGTMPQTDAQTAKSKTNSEMLDGKRTVVDAGHGGFDPGAISANGTYESAINLAVAEYLRAELESCGANVVMTREKDTGLGNTQDESLAERRSIIEQSGADIVISIHMNFYEKDTDVCGPVALFMPGSEKGKTLAEAMQQALNDALGTNGASRSQDLYVLRSGNMPCVLIECGYLSNADEEEKLKQSDYQRRIAGAICDGAAAYFSGE